MLNVSIKCIKAMMETLRRVLNVRCLILLAQIERGQDIFFLKDLNGDVRILHFAMSHTQYTSSITAENYHTFSSSVYTYAHACI